MKDMTSKKNMSSNRTPRRIDRNPATEHLTSQIQEEDCDSCTI